MRLEQIEFLDELEDLTTSLRREIESKALGLDSSPAAIAERRHRVLHGDYRFFAYTYFPHHVWGEPSEFQQNFCQRFPKLLYMPGGCVEWWIAPRGEAKSSLLTKIGPVFVAAMGLLQKADVRQSIGWETTPPRFLDYALLLGAEMKQPTKLLAVVRTELESNPSLLMDFPEICGQGPTWKVGEIVTRNGVKFEPFGAEQAVRGTFHGASRPSVLLPDDLITDKEAKSKTERDNRWNWVNKAIKYLGPPDGSVKFIGAGTVLNQDDPISRAKKAVGHVVHHYKAISKFPDNMDLWHRCEEIMRNDDARLAAESAEDDPIQMEQLPSHQFYLKNKKKMEAGAVTSWPSVRSLYVLMRARAEDRRAFGTEMQGEPRSDEDKVFTNITFWVQRLQHWIYFGACDPSMGKSEKSDPSAILVGGWDRMAKRLEVVHADSKRRIPTKLQADLISAQREFGCQVWAFENNNAYEYMRTAFIKSALDQSVSLPLRGVVATVPPEVRIDSIEPFINALNPMIRFHPSLIALLEQLDTWPEPQSHHHYDALVALHLLWMVAASRGRGLPKIISLPRSE